MDQVIKVWRKTANEFEGNMGRKISAITYHFSVQYDNDSLLTVAKLSGYRAETIVALN